MQRGGGGAAAGLMADRRHIVSVNLNKHKLTFSQISEWMSGITQSDTAPFCADWGITGSVQPGSLYVTP